MKFKEAEKNRRQEEDVSKPPFVPPLPQTHESALANSAFSNVVIGIRILVYYYFQAIVGTFLAGPCGDALFFWKTSVPAPECGMQPPLPTEGEVLHVFSLCFCGFSFLQLVKDLGHFAD